MRIGRFLPKMLLKKIKLNVLPAATGMFVRFETTLWFVPEPTSQSGYGQRPWRRLKSCGYSGDI